MSLVDLGGVGTKGKFARTGLALPLDLLTIITRYSENIRYMNTSLIRYLGIEVS